MARKRFQQPKFRFLYEVLLVFASTISANYYVSANTNMFTEGGQDQFRGVDSTSSVFGVDNVELFPVSYFDINADKLTDLIAVTKDRSTIIIFLANDKPPFLERKLDSINITEQHGEKRIISVRPGDFTGDGVVDLMVTLAKDKYNYTEFKHGVDTSVDIIFCQIVIGDLTSYGINLECPGAGSGSTLKNLVQEPMALDLNGDMVLDLLGEVWVPKNNGTTYTKKRVVWLSEPDPIMDQRYRFEWKSLAFGVIGNFKNESRHDMINISSNAYADLDANRVPELMMLTQNTRVDHSLSEPMYMYILETYEIEKDENNDRVSFSFTKPPQHIKTPYQTSVMGQPIVIDLEHNGNLSHLIPYCWDKKCVHFGIYVVNQEKVVPLPLRNLMYDGVSWSFIPPQHHPLNKTHPDKEGFTMEAFYSRALTLLVGDYNLDGFPDLLGVLMADSKGQESQMTRAVIFENVPCSPTPESPCYSSRTFTANFDIFKDYKNVISASFYDIEENGVLDVILVQQRQDEPVAPQFQEFVIKAFKNEMSFDSSFLKVMVLTGQKCGQCPSDIPYGNVLPGATVRYSSLNSLGELEHGVVVQTYRTSHLSLDLPCEIFGIGHSPNFIETLSVSVAPNSDESYMREWLQIIPNSQVVVVPNPVNRPNHWTMKLFLTPSDAVLQTFGVLVGIGAVFATLTAALELKERREDRIARQSEAHRLVMY